jgi:hypothetical protein
MSIPFLTCCHPGIHPLPPLAHLLGARAPSAVVVRSLAAPTSCMLASRYRRALANHTCWMRARRDAKGFQRPHSLSSRATRNELARARSASRASSLGALAYFASSSSSELTSADRTLPAAAPQCAFELRAEENIKKV